MIREKVAELLNSELMIENLDFDADFTQDSDLDSIALLDFIMTIEEEFDIEISEDELNELRTANDIVKLIETKTGN